MLPVLEVYDHPNEDPLAHLRDTPLYHIARAEVAAVVPPEVSECAAIRVRDVRDLMILAFMRGVTWRRERH